MKKVLVISEAYPLPEKTGSRQRTIHFVRYFKQFADVDLLCSVYDGKEILHNDIFRNVIHVPLEVNQVAGDHKIENSIKIRPSSSVLQSH